MKKGADSRRSDSVVGSRLRPTRLEAPSGPLDGSQPRVHGSGLHRDLERGRLDGSNHPAFFEAASDFVLVDAPRSPIAWLEVAEAEHVEPAIGRHRSVQG